MCPALPAQPRLGIAKPGLAGWALDKAGTGPGAACGPAPGRFQCRAERGVPGERDELRPRAPLSTGRGCHWLRRER